MDLMDRFCLKTKTGAQLGHFDSGKHSVHFALYVSVLQYTMYNIFYVMQMSIRLVLFGENVKNRLVSQ